VTQTQKVIQKVYPILALNHNLIRNQFQIRNPYLNHYQRPFLSQAQNQLRTPNQSLVLNLYQKLFLSQARNQFRTPNQSLVLNHYQKLFLSQAQNQLRTLNQFLVPNLPLNQKLSVNRRVFQTL
jgi:hypothetical protein